jgi:hypothetical protein
MPPLNAAVPIFMMSSALFTYNLGSSQLQRPDDPISTIYHCFRLLAGVRVVSDPFWDRIKNSDIYFQMFDLAEGDDVETLDMRAEHEQEQMPEILDLRRLTDSSCGLRDKEPYLRAIHGLHVASLRLRFASLQSNEYSLVLGWITQTEEHFVDLVGSSEPIACVILCYFAALLAQCRPVWWIGAWPEWLLTASERVLTTTTPELLRWLDWPRQIISSKERSVAPMPTPLDN